LEAAWEKRKAAGVIDSATMAMEKMKGEEFVPENNAPIVAYLASDAGGNITGCAFHVFGNEIRLYDAMWPTRTIYSRGVWTIDEVKAGMPRIMMPGALPG
ncbi:MAG: hypothetical protein COS88_01765, partial [Chloroflexi bacterium CG07_land_8_20_14_0_80_51_10]